MLPKNNDIENNYNPYIYNKDNNMSLNSFQQSILKAEENKKKILPNKDNNNNIFPPFQPKNNENNKFNAKTNNIQNIFYTPKGLKKNRNYVNEPIKVNHLFNI